MKRTLSAVAAACVALPIAGWLRSVSFAQEELRVAPAAIVTGIVTDELGRPVPDLFVTALKTPVTGPPAFTAQWLDPGKTDPRGHYRLPIREEGEYVVAVVVPHSTGHVGPRDWCLLAPLGPTSPPDFDFLVRTPGFEPVEELVDPTGRFTRPDKVFEGGGPAPSPIGNQGVTLTYVTTFAPDAVLAERGRRIRATAGQQFSQVNIRLQTRRSSTVSGRVVKAGEGLVAAIDFVGAWGTARTASYPDGAFVLMDLPDGAYTVSATVYRSHCDLTWGDPIRWRSSEGISLPLTRGRDLQIDLGVPLPAVASLRVTETFRPAVTAAGFASIAGRIVSDDHRPTDRALIRITSVNDERVRTTTSDDNGNYAFDGLTAGVYALAASRAGYPSVAYGLRYAAEGGTAIRLKERERFVANLTMVRGAWVSGVVFKRPGVPFRDAVVELRLTDDAYASARSDDEGRYVLGPIPPGQYLFFANLDRVVRVSGQPVWRIFYPGALSRAAARPLTVAAGQVIEGADFDLSMADDAPTIDTSTSTAPLPTVSIPIRLRVEGSPLAPGLPRFEVEAIPVTSGNPWRTIENGWLSTWSLVGAQTAETPVPVGRYITRAQGPAPGWVVRSVAVDGRDALDTPFVVTAGNVPNAEVVLTNHVTTLEGSVTNSAGRPTSLATLIVFSRDPQFWTAVSRRVRVLRPRSDGSYSTTGLPPGDYLLHAVPSVPPGQRVDDVFLAGVASRATPVRLVDDRAVRQDVALGDRR